MQKKKRKEEQNPANSNTATWEEIGLVASRFFRYKFLYT